jgi:cell shape-determining protein MreC
MRDKPFDCVRMKNEAQQRLNAEFEHQRDEFSSFSDFLAHKTTESREIQAFKERLRKTKGRASA